MSPSPRRCSAVTPLRRALPSCGRVGRPLVLALAVAMLPVGCAATPKTAAHPTTPAPTVVEMEPMRVQAQHGQVEVYDAGELFEKAGADMQANRFTEAAAGYDRLVKEFPTSRYVVAALYNAGLALEGNKDYAGAATRYRRIAQEHANAGKDVLDALFRMGGCYAEVENWAASAEAFAQLLEEKDLSLGDRIEAMARRGLAQYQMKDGRAAERTFRDALAYYRQNEALERTDDFFVAMSQFYLGEISHDAFRAMPLRLPQKQLEQDLEAKATLLLSTQALYVDTARVRNPAWATAAGYQMAMLYKEMYDAILAAPIPPELNDEAKQVYVEELKKTIEPLLRKAIHAHELTQGVAERSGIDNEWVRKSNAQMEQLRALLTPGAAALPSSPVDPGPAPATPRPSIQRNDKIAPSSQPPSQKRDYAPRVIL